MAWYIRFLGNDLWKATAASKLYDYKLIHGRLLHLRAVRESGDALALIYYLRSGLLRNLGGMCDVRLFSRSALGTKHLIEEYMDEVVAQIRYIAETDFPDISKQQKLDFFNNTRQSFGCSALVLYGGATFGLYHLGVVKTLQEHGLLPRIICGSAVGSLIAALICIHTDDELPHIFQSDGINLTAFSRKGNTGTAKRKIARFLKHGYLMDIRVLEDCVKANVGDLTFEEAYARTNRILNITVSSTRKFEVPQFLNYLTAPNVLIRSAACASTASLGLYDSVELLAKDKTGRIVQWSPSTITWNKWTEATSAESDTSLSRLAELFNVNHFIVSQANPYVVPFLRRNTPGQSESLLMRMSHVLSAEFRCRMWQLDQMHALPRFLRGLISEPISGNITITPSLNFADVQTMLANPTSRSLDYWILKGEQATWPLLAMICTRCKIELALDKTLLALKKPALVKTIGHYPRPTNRTKRTKSTL